MAAGLREMAQQYVYLNELRKKLEKSASELKEKENEVKSRILLELSAQGLSSVKLEGIGSLIRASKTHYEITDIELLAHKIYEGMQDCERNGRVLSDALILQSRISREPLEAYLPSDAKEADYAAFGVKKVEDTVLSVRKS